MSEMIINKLNSSNFSEPVSLEVERTGEVRK